MMKLDKKLLALLVSLALLLTISVSSTVAYLVDGTEPVENKFTPASVTPEIHETFNKQEKKNVYFTNEGDVSAYFRATFVITLKKGNQVLQAVEGTHYTLDLGERWETGSDGFYYWPGDVDADGKTENLIDSCASISGAIPDGYTLHVEVLVQAIQADGWPEGVDNAQEAFAEAAKSN